MPSNIGGDQLDDDYAPWFKNEVMKPSRRTEDFFMEKGLNLLQHGYYAHKREIGTAEKSGLPITLGILQPRKGLVTLLYDLENIEQIEAVLDFRIILSKYAIPYRPEDVPREAYEVIDKQFSQTQTLIKKAGYKHCAKK